MNHSEPVPVDTFPRLYVPPSDDDAQAAVDFAEAVALPSEFGPLPPDRKLTAIGPNAPSYLVLLQGANEDVPLGLFHERDEAVEFAREVRDNPETHAERYFAVTRRNSAFLNPHWLAVSIVEFDGPIVTASTVLFEIDS